MIAHSPFNDKQDMVACYIKNIFLSIDIYEILC